MCRCKQNPHARSTHPFTRSLPLCKGIQQRWAQHTVTLTRPFLNPSCVLCLPPPPFAPALSHAIVSTSVGPEYYVTIMSFVDKTQLEPGCSVLLHNKVSWVLALLFFSESVELGVVSVCVQQRWRPCR